MHGSLQILVTSFLVFFVILVAWFSLLWISIVPVLPCPVKIVNKLLRNTLVTSSPKTKLLKWDEKLTREITFSHLSDFQPMVGDNAWEKSSWGTNLMWMD